jgi:hypothetical protein
MASLRVDRARGSLTTEDSKKQQGKYK